MASEKGEADQHVKAVGRESGSSSAAPGDSPTKKPTKNRVLDLFGGWYYGWEIFGVIASGMAIAAIAIVTNYYDDREAPDWHAKVGNTKRTFHLTINSLLSILSVFGSTCAMIPVTKGLGQLKYIWFLDKDRSLADLETFDSASRGKVGSAQLIWRLRFKHLAVLGGLASLLVLAFGPFVQNLIVVSIQYRDASKNSLVSWSTTYGFGNGSEVERTMSYKMKLALDDTSSDWVVPPNQCVTGNCKWDKYFTLAACSRCADITSKLERTCKPKNEGGCKVALPNGMSLDVHYLDPNEFTDIHGTVMAINTTSTPLVYSNYSNPFIRIQSIFGFDPQQYPLKQDSGGIKVYSITEDSILSAHECVIVPCVQQQQLILTDASESDSEDGRPQPRVSLSINQTWDTPVEGDGSSGNGVTIDFNPSDHMDLETLGGGDVFPNFGMDTPSYKAIQAHLKALLDGSVTSESFGNTFQVLTQDTATSFEELAFIFRNSLYANWTGTMCDSKESNVACAMTNLAVGITNAIRVASWESSDSWAPFKGTTLAPVNICSAQWQYISAPVAVWVLGLALLVGTILKTRRAQIKTWRTSPLAMLLLKLDSEGLDHLRDWQHMGDEELKELAETLRLRLYMDNDGPRFVQPQKNESAV